MISIKNVIVFIVSSFLVLGCHSRHQRTDVVKKRVDYVLIGVKSGLTRNVDGYVNIWIEKQTPDEQLEMERSLVKSNVAFRQQENAYFIDKPAPAFLIRNIPITVQNERVLVNHQDATDRGNVVITKNSEIFVGSFYW